MVRTSVSVVGSASRAGTSGSVSFADEVIALDPMNPTTAARLVQPLASWRRHDPAHQALMRRELGRVLAEVAANLRSPEKYQVEKLTELQVSSLQIHIQGVKRTA